MKDEYQETERDFLLRMVETITKGLTGQSVLSFSDPNEPANLRKIVIFKTEDEQRLVDIILHLAEYDGVW